MIQHQCPMCRTLLHSADQLAGTTVSCPDCSWRIVVPASGVSPIVSAPAEPPVAVTPTPQAVASPKEIVDWIIKGAPRDQIPAGVRFTPPPKRSKAKLIGICAAVSLLVVILSWFLAGTKFLNIALAIAAIIPGVLFAGILLSIPRGMSTGNFRWSNARPAMATFAGWGLYLGATVGAGFFVHLYFAKATIYVDNFADQTVRLELDGKPWLTLAGKTNQTAILRRGNYVVVIIAGTGNEQLDRMELNVEDRGPFILNVLGAQTYARGSITYGGFFAPPPEVAVKTKWIKANVDYLFEEPPTSISVSVRRGQSAGSQTKTYLRRGEPKKDDRK